MHRLTVLVSSMLVQPAPRLDDFAALCAALRGRDLSISCELLAQEWRPRCGARSSESFRV